MSSYKRNRPVRSDECKSRRMYADILNFYISNCDLLGEKRFNVGEKARREILDGLNFYIFRLLVIDLVYTRKFVFFFIGKNL